MSVGWTEIQAPVSELRVVLRASWAFMGIGRERSVVAKLACLGYSTSLAHSCLVIRDDQGHAVEEGIS